MRNHFLIAFSRPWAPAIRAALGPSIISLILLVGCGTVASTPTARPSPTPSMSPETSGPAAFIIGRESCGVSTGSITREADGIASHMRGGSVTCYDEANDPRVSGRMTGTFEADGWGTTDPPPLFVEWGVLRLENSDGAWDGSYRGFYTQKRGDDITAWFTGSGAYAGLTYYQVARPAPGTVISGYEYYGFIYPGLPPNP